MKVRKMADDALFNLRWDAQRSALLGSMATLYREEAFVDTTLVADNKIFKAHKLLLSAASSYLKLMLESVPSLQHAVIFMPHISASDLGNLLKFIYDGEIKINKRSLKSFLAVAKLLRIKGMDFELNEDLDTDIAPAYAQNLSTTSAIQSPSNPNKRLAMDAKLDNDEDVSIVNGNNIPSKIFSSSSSSSTNNNSQMRTSSRSTPPKENGVLSSTPGGNNNNNSSSDEESKSMRGVLVPRPALISGSGRSTTSSVSSCQALSPHNNDNNNATTTGPSTNNTPRLIQHLNNIINNALNSNVEDDEEEEHGSPPTMVRRPNGGDHIGAGQDQDENNSNASGGDNNKNNRALNLHIGHRFNQPPQHHDRDESLDMDQDSRGPQFPNLGGGGVGDDREGANSSIGQQDNELDDDYDDDDDSFSMSIQPEVSLRESESDEAFINLNERRKSFPDNKHTNFSNSFNLSMFGNSALSVTQTAGGGLAGGGPMGGGSSPYSIQQQLTLKHLSKLARPIMIPKAHHHQLPGQGSPQGGGGGMVAGINEGILMRMMREPLQSGSCSSKPMKLDGVGNNSGSFFDIPHNDPNLHSAGLRKQKRYVQCTSCSKVLSSLSALKRHMEDVHCARIQGKCLLCGRVYSSRNSLLTHVYSAHKKHHDYKAVARIIRESDFEQFATA